MSYLKIAHVDPERMKKRLASALGGQLNPVESVYIGLCKALITANPSALSCTGWEKKVAAQADSMFAEIAEHLGWLEAFK